MITDNIMSSDERAKRLVRFYSLSQSFGDHCFSNFIIHIITKWMCTVDGQ